MFMSMIGRWAQEGYLNIQYTAGTFARGLTFSLSLLLITAAITPNAHRRKRPTAVEILARVLPYFGDKIFQRYIENLRIDVTPATVEAKRLRRMQACDGPAIEKDWGRVYKRKKLGGTSGPIKEGRESTMRSSDKLQGSGSA